jgi:hypothetical protein
MRRLAEGYQEVVALTRRRVPVAPLSGRADMRNAPLLVVGALTATSSEDAFLARLSSPWFS